jgi:general secretion pathway protein I
MKHGFSAEVEQKSHGFSLLEAIVALVILTSAGMAVFAWFNASFMSFQRIEAARQRDEAVRSALGLLETINPMLAPSGEQRLGDYAVSWQAREVEAPRDGMNFMGAVSLYRVGLYLTQVEVRRLEEPLARFELRQVGYEQVRQIPTDF